MINLIARVSLYIVGPLVVLMGIVGIMKFLNNP
jgi:hypothetical protein